MTTPSAFTVQGSGSGIQALSATLPLVSSGGQFPDIYIGSAIPVNLGGSSNVTAAAFELLAGGTTTTNPYQSIPSVNAGYVLTDNGAGALPTFQASAASGSYTLLATATASNSASVNFTGLNATYFAYKILMWGVAPITNAANLITRMSIDNGATYDSGANYNWGYNVITTGTGGTVITGLSSSGITIISNMSATPAALMEGEITLYNPFQAQNVYLTTLGISVQPAEVITLFNGGGAFNGSTPVNAIQFLMSAGNISSGVFKLYGLVA